MWIWNDIWKRKKEKRIFIICATYGVATITKGIRFDWILGKGTTVPAPTATAITIGYNFEGVLTPNPYGYCLNREREKWFLNFAATAAETTNDNDNEILGGIPPNTYNFDFERERDRNGTTVPLPTAVAIVIVLFVIVYEFGMVFYIIIDYYERAGVSTPDATSDSTITGAIAPNATNFDAVFAPLCAAAVDATIGVVMRFFLFPHQKTAIVATKHIFMVISV